MPTVIAFFGRALVFLLLLTRAAVHASKRLILVFGDSLSSGYHIEVEDSCPALLNIRRQKSRQDLRVVNASPKGKTTGGGRNRLATVLDEYQSAFVILKLGANDDLRQQPLSTMQETLNEMLGMIRVKGSTPILMGMKLPPYFDPSYRDQFQRLLHARVRILTPHSFRFFLKTPLKTQVCSRPTACNQTPPASAKLLGVVWPGLSKALEQQ